MTTYTQKQIAALARDEAKAVRLASDRPARVESWRILLNGAGGSSLVVAVRAYDGIRERYVAI